MPCHASLIQKQSNPGLTIYRALVFKSLLRLITVRRALLTLTSSTSTSAVVISSVRTWNFHCPRARPLLTRFNLGIRGYPTRTNPKNKQGSGDFSGELSIAAVEVVLLSPCLHQVGHCDRVTSSYSSFLTRFRSPMTTTVSRTPSSDSASATSIS